MEIPRLRGVIGGPARSPPDDQEYNDERHEDGIHDDDDGDDGYNNRLDKDENDKMPFCQNRCQTIINHPRSPPDAQEYNAERHEGGSDDDHGGGWIKLAIIIMMMR